MLRREWAILLSNARNISAGVIDPHCLGRVTLREKYNVSFYALAVRRESAARKPQHRMQIAILSEQLEYLARLVRKEAVVRQDDAGATTLFQNRHDVLDKIKLLVRGCDREVLALRCLVCTLSAEGRVRQHYVEAVAWRRLVDGVAQFNCRLDAVKVQVHKREPTWAWHQLLSIIGTAA